VKVFSYQSNLTKSGSAVEVEFQNNKFEVMFFEDGFNKYCHLKNVKLKYSHMSESAKVFFSSIFFKSSMVTEEIL
jgi:hypothetical protein